MVAFLSVRQFNVVCSRLLISRVNETQDGCRSAEVGRQEEVAWLTAASPAALHRRGSTSPSTWAIPSSTAPSTASSRLALLTLARSLPMRPSTASTEVYLQLLHNFRIIFIHFSSKRDKSLYVKFWTIPFHHTIYSCGHHFFSSSSLLHGASTVSSSLPALAASSVFGSGVEASGCLSGQAWREVAAVGVWECSNWPGEAVVPTPCFFFTLRVNKLSNGNMTTIM